MDEDILWYRYLVSIHLSELEPLFKKEKCDEKIVEKLLIGIFAPP